MDNKKHECPPKSADELDTTDIDETRLAKLIASDPSVSDYLQVLLIKYPCHNCNKSDLKVILRGASELQPKLLCIDFVTQIVDNVRSNEDKLDWELVQMMAKIITNFLKSRPDIVDRNRHEKVFAVDLLPMARMLLSRYYVVKNTDWNRSLLDVVLDLLLAIIRTVHDFSPDEELEQDLIKLYALHQYGVFFFVLNAVKHMGVSETSWKLFNGFTTGIHETYRDRWQLNSRFAFRYAWIIVFYEQPYVNTKGRFRKMINEQAAKALIEIFRNADRVIPDRQIMMYLFLLSLPDNVLADLLKYFSEKIAWAISQPINLYHDTHLATSDTVAKKSNDALHMVFLNDLVGAISKMRSYTLDERGFDFHFINDLVRLANYDINCDVLYRNMILEVVSHHLIPSYGDETAKLPMLQSGIAQTIRGVIDNLQEKCSLCTEMIDLMHELLSLMIPESSIIRNALASRKNTELATSLPYAIQEKQTLMQIMHPDGWDMLIKQLEQGKDVESLHMLARTFRREHVDTWETIPCTNHTVSHTEGTKVFVLDDGTKIRAETSHLAEKSKFFSNLFDGRFAEASRDEVRLSKVSALQFNFIANNTSAKPSMYKINYDMDAEEHIGLITLCDELMLYNLRDSVVDSLRWHHMDEKCCLEVYKDSIFYGIVGLRKACVNFALIGDVHAAPKPNCLQNLFQELDKELLIKDITEWLMEEHDGDLALQLSEVEIS